jgi:Tol biopolymer transport system component
MPLVNGSTLGPYEIVELLGRGGMGEVYRARDAKLRRDVAIKILPPSLANDPERLRRFEREAQVLASLNHPNIAAIYGLEAHGGSTALVLELVEGDTLDVRLSGRPLPFQDAIAIARLICDGLDAAHERGIVHRDLKPSNIKVTADGVVKLLDFGLAKPLRESPDVTQSPTVANDSVVGVLLGTVSYMSPEQARGRPVDKRTDVWSFGCVFYEMLTGRTPFAAETISDTIAAVLGREPNWSALPASTPHYVHLVLRRCLAKDLRLRMRDIADARAGLDETAATADSGQTAMPGLPAAQRVRALIAGAAAGAMIAAAITLFLARAQRATWTNPLAGASFTRLTDFEGAEHDAAISPDGKFVAFRADRDGPFDVWLTQVGTGRVLNLTQGTDDERRTRTGSVGFNGDGSEIWLGGGPDRRLRLMPMLGGAPRVFLGEGATHIKWSHDGTRIVYHTNEKGVDPIFVADATGEHVSRIFQGPYAGWHNHFPTWSPDGRWIYFVSGIYAANEMDVWRIGAAGGTPERLTQHNSDAAYPTPIDDRTVLYVSRDTDGSGPWLWALDVERKSTHRVSFGLELYTSVAANRDGRRLVGTVANPSASLWTVPIRDRQVTETDVAPYAVPTVNAIAPRFGPQALFYLSSAGAGSGLWRASNGQAAEVWRGADGALFEPPAVSPEGTRVVIVLRRNGKLRLRVRSADGADMRPLADDLEVQGTGHWSPDGKWIVTGGHDAEGDGLFKVPVEGGAAIRLVKGPALNPAWSGDGRVIVYSGPEVAGLMMLMAVDPAGQRVELPAIRVRAGDGERARFVPGTNVLVYMQGLLPPQDFWSLDLATGKTRQLTSLSGRAAMRTFDITPDGRQIVFDRLRENSDIVLIDLPAR